MQDALIVFTSLITFAAACLWIVVAILHVEIALAKKDMDLNVKNLDKLIRGKFYELKSRLG